MKKSILIATLLLFYISNLSAQEPKPAPFSLEECIRLALDKNINITKAQLEQKQSQYKIAEAHSELLPQIAAVGSFQDNLKLPTTMLPGVIIGRPGEIIPVQMGSQYNANAAITVNQILYNQTAFTSLKIAKLTNELSHLNIEKAREGISKEIARLYFLVQTTTEQGKLIEENISRTLRMTSITKTLLDNGMGKQVDYDRMNVNLQNLHTQLNNTEALHEQQLNMMKYMLEIPMQQGIILTDSASMPLINSEPLSAHNFSSHVDIQILESQKDIARMNQRKVKNAYLPTVSFIGQLGYQGLRSEFKDYFNSSTENKWNGAYFIGINISIPIFDGFNKRSRSRHTKLEYEKSELILNDTKKHFEVEFNNARNNYYNNKKNVKIQQQNIALAEKVYAETALKYREGLSSISDLLQDEIGLSNAQAGYLNALYNFKEAELQIMSLNGEIRRLMNN